MTDTAAPRSPRDASRWLVGLGGVLIGAWALRFLGGGDLPPGNDITGHLQRTAYGVDELWASGRLDGWYPGAMLGYQEFLFYGPGLTALVAAVRLVTLGLASDPGALKAVLVAAYLAVPFTTARLGRAWGLSPTVAAGAGVLALAASSTRGGGIEGAFATGLAAHQVAVPLVILALALLTERLGADAEPSGRPVRRGPLPLALTVTAIALTHPLSLVLLALLSPLCLAMAWATGHLDRSAWRTIPLAAGWTLGLSAWWWLPALAAHDLRGPVTSFTLPGVWDHVRLLTDGVRGWRGVAGPSAAALLGATVVAGVLRRQRSAVALAAMPVAALGLLHAAHGLLGLDHDLGRQLPNRGLVLVAVVAAPGAAAGAEHLVSALAEVSRLRAPVGLRRLAAFSVLAAVTVVSLTAVEIGPVDRQEPAEALHDVASVLAAEVPDGARFSWVGEGGDHLGVPEPQRWLAWKSDRNGTAPFGPEYAPGAGAARVASEGPGAAGVDAWIDEVRHLAVTHLVAADREVVASIAGHERLDTRYSGNGLHVWRIEGRPGITCTCSWTPDS